MKEYKESGGGQGDNDNGGKSKSTPKAKKDSKKDIKKPSSANKSMSGTSFKSKEYLSDDDTSSDEDNKVRYSIYRLFIDFLLVPTV